jgi:hypothetical protein
LWNDAASRDRHGVATKPRRFRQDSVSLTASDFFVFAGAGASLSPPAALPLFDWLRDAILTQLGFDTFVAGTPRSNPRDVMVAQALAPEPFMGDLKAGRVDVERWLSEVLGRGRPNAVHQTLAELASAGAKVWTVNFDTLIEQSTAGLRTVSWPQMPTGAERLVHAHGSLGGPLIFGADQVLTPLPDEWLNRLRSDINGRTAIFIGYSGRDLDFQPLWNEALRAACEVLWFEVRDPHDPSRVIEEKRKRQLLLDVHRRGVLSFPPPVAPPPGVSALRPNPSWDFVMWFVNRGLVSVDVALARELFDPVPAVAFPRLSGDPTWARASIAGHLGAYAAMRAQYAALVASRRSAEAARLLSRSFITHGGGRMAAGLTAAYLLPPIGPAAKAREMLLRKRLTALHRIGRHRLVLRRTEKLAPDALSTWLILRSSSLRMVDSLDDAAAIAEEALRRARLERHVVRTAHAAFQKSMALLWAEQIIAAAQCLHDELEPLATVAANRWIAWSQFVAGALAVREDDSASALSQLRLAGERFMAEGLIDGAISAAIARLTAHRLARDQDGFVTELEQVQLLRTAPHKGHLYYARRNVFTIEAIAIEEAEFARCHQADAATARRFYAEVARSPYPLHASLGFLGLALVEKDPSLTRAPAERARDIGARIGARLVMARADEVLRGRTREIFFC